MILYFHFSDSLRHNFCTYFGSSGWNPITSTFIHMHSICGYDLIVIKYYSCNCFGPMRKEGSFYFRQSSNDVMMCCRKQTCLYHFDEEKFGDSLIFLWIKSTWTIVVSTICALWAVICLHLKSILAIWILLCILVFLVFNL